jgi:phosphoribosyl-ATP pyrophosphohydrolase
MNALTRVKASTFTDLTTEVAERAAAEEIERLFAALDQVTWSGNPRTARLLASGLRKKSQKVVEEAAEVALETVRKHKHAAVRESADLIYHLVVLWHECGIEPRQVWAEMRRRAKANGIAEKLPKPPERAVPASDSITLSVQNS